MYKYLILNHIPRCGGTSLRKSFFQGVKSNDYFQQGPIYISDLSHGNISLWEKPNLIEAIHPETLLFIDHSPALFIEDSFKINVAEVYRILTLRHPLSRIVSHVHFFYNQHIDTLPETALKSYLSRFGNMTIHQLTDYKYPDKSLDEQYSISKSMIKDYQFYFKVEDQKLCEVFNGTNPFQLHIPNYHINKSPIDTKLGITNKTKNYIYQYIRPEIKLLEEYYEMDL